MTMKCHTELKDKLTCDLEKDMINFHLKVSKLGLWWDPFVQTRKGMILKITEDLFVMTMKNNAKFEEELTCHFTTDTRTWLEYLKI